MRRNVHGQWFEDYLEHLHRRYRDTGRALVGKVPTPTRAVYQAGRKGVVFVPTARGMPDYVGCLPGGRYVAFDAKATKNKTRWRVKTGGARSRGSVHQWEWLRQVQAIEGIAFFLVYAYEIERMYLARLPFELGPMMFTEMTEVTEDENGWYDWLAALALGY